jgi:G3E family GTPase
VLVLSRADRLDPAGRDPARARVVTHNGIAVVALAGQGQLVDPAGATLEDLLAARSHDLPPPAPRTAGLQLLPPPSHLPGIGQVSLLLAGELDEERFADWVETALGAVGGRLLRWKGILAIAGVDERVILQGVADEQETTLGAPWASGPRSSRLVLIGYGLDAAALQAGFAACAHRDS